MVLMVTQSVLDTAHETRIQVARRGGYAVWTVKDPGADPELLFAAGDDIALLEWFARQLALPVPKLPGPSPHTQGPAADAAGASAPAADGLALKAEAELKAIRQALQPLTKYIWTVHAFQRPLGSPMDWKLAELNETTGEYAAVTFGDLCALIRAAGLWSDVLVHDEMQAAPAQAGAPSAAPAAADTSPPPAEAFDLDEDLPF